MSGRGTKRGPDPRRLVRPLVRSLHPYVPGEQPRVPGLVKLNTNENPYPPSPAVLEAVAGAADARLRLYPPPTAAGLRERIARLHGCGPENVIVGNGSDELLAMAVRAFVEPCVAGRDVGARNRVQYFDPSYSLYPVLVANHGAQSVPVPLADGFALPTSARLRRDGVWDADAALTFVTTPNAPSGRGYSTAELEGFCRLSRGVVVLDEAYADFADENAMDLALRYRHVLVSRTFSKGYSLCFLRVGYFVGDAELIGALDRIRDSYNVNGLAQVAAEATLGDLGYYRKCFRRVRATRKRLTRELARRGFDVLPSSTNFVFVRPPGGEAERWFGALRERKVLARWFSTPGISDRLRITIGTDEEIDVLLGAVDAIIPEFS